MLRLHPVLIFLSLIFISCDGFFFSEFKVINAELKKDSLIISFSDLVDPVSVNKAISLSCDGKNVSVDLSSKKNLVTVSPINGFYEKHDWVLTVSSSAENVHGLSLKRNFVHKFSTRTSDRIPSVISVFPENNSFVKDNLEAIVLQFNSSMEEASVENGLYISPSVESAFVWNEEADILKIQFFEKLKENTRYVITLQESAKNTENLGLKKAFESTFLYKADEEKLELNFFLNCDEEKIPLSTDKINHLSLKDKLLLSFSKPVSRTVLVNNLYLSPAFSHSVIVSVENPNEALVSFFDEIEWGSSVKVEVYPSLSSLNNVCLDEKIELDLAFDLDCEKPPLFRSMIFEINKNSYFELSEKNSYSYLVLDVEHFPLNTTVEIPVWFVFEHSPLSEGISLKSLLNGISFTSTNNCVFAYGKRIWVFEKEQVSETEVINQFYKDEINCSFVKLLLCVENYDKEGLFKIKISDEVCDSLLNRIQNPITLVVNKK